MYLGTSGVLWPEMTRRSYCPCDCLSSGQSERCYLAYEMWSLAIADRCRCAYPGLSACGLVSAREHDNPAEARRPVGSLVIGASTTCRLASTPRGSRFCNGYVKSIAGALCENQ